MKYYPLNPRQMALTCRKLARDMRAEAAEGYGPISLASPDPPGYELISRRVAASSMDEQAERWEQEAETGIENRIDREKIGW